MFRLSGPATLAALMVGIATIGLEVAAIVAYRDSTDGQTGVLWAFIVVYGFLAVAVIKVIDSTVRRMRGRTSAHRDSGSI